MGWLSFPSRGRSTIDILKQEIEAENASRSQRIVAHSIKPGVAYLVIESRPKPGHGWEPDLTYINDADGAYRVILVILTNRRRDRDGHDFAFKDMSESMGPYQCDCPQWLIDMASPLRPVNLVTLKDPAGYARAWREKCAQQRVRKRKRGKLGLADGDVVRFAQPIKFTSGFSGDRFVAKTVERRGRRCRVFESLQGGGGYFRISGLDSLDFEIERRQP